MTLIEEIQHIAHRRYVEDAAGRMDGLHWCGAHYVLVHGIKPASSNQATIVGFIFKSIHRAVDSFKVNIFDFILPLHVQCVAVVDVVYIHWENELHLIIVKVKNPFIDTNLVLWMDYKLNYKFILLFSHTTRLSMFLFQVSFNSSFIIVILLLKQFILPVAI